MQNLHKGPGVYLFKDRRGRPLYIGKSTHLLARVKSHLSSRGPKAASIVKESATVEGIPVRYELEALLLEAKLIKEHKPKFNSRAKDDKHPLYIKVTGEEYPKITTSRLEDLPNARYYGPFPSSRALRQVLRQIRKIFPYCAKKSLAGRPCFYSHLGLCNPCPNKISKIKNQNAKSRQTSVYRANIRNIRNILSGKTDKVTLELERKMKKAAKAKKFEEAVLYRDQLRRLEYITTPYKPTTAYLENPHLLEDIHAAEKNALARVLRKHAGISVNPRRIECFDAAHLRGSDSTASMVTFVDGEPEKRFYRHFKIKSGEGMNDFASISEVFSRRARHFTDWGKPDLFIVDGGKPQISAARKALRDQKIDLPLIGLAKRQEEIIALRENRRLKTRSFKSIKLARNSPALHILQRIRDEAHRFARSYHLKLRLKTLHNEV